MAHASGVRVVPDGAHTPTSAVALAAALAVEEPRRRGWIVLGVAGDKDAGAIARALGPVASGFVATQAASPRAMAATAMASSVATAGRRVEMAATVAEAVERAVGLAGEDGLVVVTGSLGVVAEAREALGLARADPAIGGTG